MKGLAYEKPPGELKKTPKHPQWPDEQELEVLKKRGFLSLYVMTHELADPREHKYNDRNGHQPPRLSFQKSGDSSHQDDLHEHENARFWAQTKIENKRKQTHRHSQAKRAERDGPQERHYGPKYQRNTKFVYYLIGPVLVAFRIELQPAGK